MSDEALFPKEPDAIDAKSAMTNGERAARISAATTPYMPPEPEPGAWEDQHGITRSAREVGLYRLPEAREALGHTATESERHDPPTAA